jgi:prolipoprotein diacylglyceryl transferase
MDYFVWNADPILVDFGMLQIRWYGLLFAAAFLTGYQIIKSIYLKENKNVENIDSLFVHIFLGTLIGARLGHCLFYDPVYYLSDPVKILYVWQGGLASHGGGIGIFISLYIYSKRFKESYIWILDRLAIPTALAGAFIRTGNFFNSEITGTPSSMPWAVVFKRIDFVPRHPVQLYEALSYALIFIFLIFLYKKFYKSLNSGMLFGVFLSCVFSARFFLEFLKVKQASYNLTGFLSAGQILSIPFIAAGIFFIIRSFMSEQ